MAVYVAFLRAINLGRNRKLPMADLRSCLEGAGLAEVETYIHTGNVRFTTSRRSREKVESYVEQTLLDSCGFDVPTIAFTPSELRRVYDDALAQTSATDPADARRYVTLLKHEPSPAEAGAVSSWDAAGERAVVRGRAVHWVVPGPSQQAALSNARLEKRLGVATTRDVKVIRTLAQRWGA